MIETYYHKAGKIETAKIPLFPGFTLVYHQITVKEQVIPYDDAQVLVVQKEHWDEGKQHVPSVMVPGIVKSKQTLSGNFEFSEVEHIRNEEDRKELEKIIRKMGLQGYINFWP